MRVGLVLLALVLLVGCKPIYHERQGLNPETGQCYRVYVPSDGGTVHVREVPCQP